MYTDGLIEFNGNRLGTKTRLLTATAESLQLRCEAEYLATFIARCKADNMVLFIAKRIVGNLPVSVDSSDVAVLTLSFEA